MLWFKGAKKKEENSLYYYSAISTHVAINYTNRVDKKKKKDDTKSVFAHTKQ